MKTVDAKKRINGYLNVDYFTKSNAIIDQSYCLFLNGPWGIGKSYLVKEIIQNRSKTDLSDVKIGYFSLAGVSDISELEESVAEFLFPKWSKIKRYMPEIDLGVTLDFVNFSTSIGSNSFIAKYIDDKLKKRQQKYIIVFDELDRKCDSLDLNAVFSLVSSLGSIQEKEDEYHRVILINNDEAFKNNNDIEKIKSFRNKISAISISLDEPDQEILNMKLKGMPNISSIKKILDNMNFNLRSNIKACNYFNEVKHLFAKDEELQSLFYILLNVAYNQESLILETERERLVKRFANVSSKGTAYEEKLFYHYNSWLNLYYDGPSSGFVYLSVINNIYARADIDKLTNIIKYFVSGRIPDKKFDVPLPISKQDIASIEQAFSLSKYGTKGTNALSYNLNSHLVNKATADAWGIAISAFAVFGIPQEFYNDVLRQTLNVYKNDIAPMDGLIFNLFKDFLNNPTISKFHKHVLEDLMALERTKLIPRNKNEYILRFH